jgi:hypothetical protein
MLKHQFVEQFSDMAQTVTVVTKAKQTAVVVAPCTHCNEHPCSTCRRSEPTSDMALATSSTASSVACGHGGACVVVQVPHFVSAARWRQERRGDTWTTWARTDCPTAKWRAGSLTKLSASCGRPARPVSLLPNLAVKWGASSVGGTVSTQLLA